MNSNTRNVIIGLCIAVNIAAVAAIGAVMHQSYVAEHTIDLGTITVTPSAEQLREVAANRVINLGTITVTPSAEQRQLYAVNITHARQRQRETEMPAFETLVQAMDILAPGQYLANSASMDLLGTLAFEPSDR